MTTTKVSVEEQMSVLMRGAEYGEPHIQATMEEELRARLAEGRPLRVYCGFDPTSTDLTLGNLVPMLKMRQFQKLGHEVTFLIGTMTGIVGDPSDKTSARQMLTVEDVQANSHTWLQQAFRVLDEGKTIIRRNGDWLAPLTLAEVVQIASNFTVAQFMEHETFRRRMAEGRPLYIHEFIYALMQAYDALHMKTDVQLGGVDQLFNIMAGRHLQRSLGERPLIAVTTPLLIGTDGNLKMSKSVGNYVGLDDEPADMYGKVMSIPDSLIVNWFTLLTDVSNEEIAAIERGLADRTLNPMDTKKRLAHSIVSLLNDEAAADAAQAEFERVFQRRQDPEESAIEVPWDALPFTSDSGEINLGRLVAEQLGRSISEVRRLIRQGAISLDGETVTSPTVQAKRGALIRVGRHDFVRLGSKLNADG